MQTPRGPLSSGSNRFVVGPAGPLVANSQLHIVGVPLLLVGLLCAGFILVYLKEVLLPFVVALGLMYVLRPLVNLLTTPFSRACWCFMLSPSIAGQQADAAARRHRTGPARYTRVAGGGGGEPQPSAEGATALAPPPPPPTHRRPRGGSGGKYATGGGGVRGVLSRVMEKIGVWAPAPAPPSTSGGGVEPGGRLSSDDDHDDSGGRRVHAAASSSHDPATDCGCACGPFRVTRCPRWLAILMALTATMGVMAGLVVLVADAVTQFERTALRQYVEQAGNVANVVNGWFAVLNIHVEANQVLDVIKS